MPDDKTYMARCIELARNGMGSTSPNPMVGCVIVYKNKIIGEGYHKKAGEAHAEVNAINAVTDKKFLTNSTLYVNLEPCSHFGKTPPCSELIIKQKIPRVVIGTIDPNLQVAGKGVAKLKAAGCDVTLNVMKPECNELNRRFFNFHQNKTPYIILKWAQTIDGFIDIDRDENCEKRPTWITDETCRKLVHKWRSEEDAILVGTNSARMDDPELTTRNWEGKNPLRLVLDRKLSLPKSLKLFNSITPTVIYNESVSKTIENNEYKAIDYNNVLNEILTDLYSRSILSLIVEGGEKLLTSFITQGLWNEARVFTGSTNFTKGIKAPGIKQEPVEIKLVGNSTLNMFRKIK